MIFAKTEKTNYKREWEEMRDQNQRLLEEIARIKETQSVTQRTACANCQYGLRPPDDCYAPYGCLLKAKEVCENFKVVE